MKPQCFGGITISSKTQEAADLVASLQFHVKEITVQCNVCLDQCQSLDGSLLFIDIYTPFKDSYLQAICNNGLSGQTISIIWSLQLGWLPLYVPARGRVGSIILSIAVRWTKAVGFYIPARLHVSGLSVNCDGSCIRSSPLLI